MRATYDETQRREPRFPFVLYPGSNTRPLLRTFCSTLLHSDDVTICRCIFMNNAFHAIRRAVFSFVFVRFFGDEFLLFFLFFSSKDDGFEKNLFLLRDILSWSNWFVFVIHVSLFLSFFSKFYFYRNLFLESILLTTDNWFISFIILKWEYSFSFLAIIFLQKKKIYKFSIIIILSWKYNVTSGR